MDVLSIIGWGGSALVVLSLLQTRILRLRVLNLVGCVILVGFNLAIGVWPMVGMNAVLAVINVVHLWRLLRHRHDQAEYEVLEVNGDDAYLGLPAAGRWSWAADESPPGTRKPTCSATRWCPPRGWTGDRPGGGGAGQPGGGGQPTDAGAGQGAARPVPGVPGGVRGGPVHPHPRSGRAGQGGTPLATLAVPRVGGGGR